MGSNGQTDLGWGLTDRNFGTDNRPSDMLRWVLHLKILRWIVKHPTLNSSSFILNLIKYCRQWFWNNYFNIISTTFSVRNSHQEIGVFFCLQHLKMHWLINFLAVVLDLVIQYSTLKGLALAPKRFKKSRNREASGAMQKSEDVHTEGQTDKATCWSGCPG